MRISDMNWMQVQEYLRRDDRAVPPLGSTGLYQRPVDEMLALWRTAVDETRALVTGSWGDAS